MFTVIKLRIKIWVDEKKFNLMMKWAAQFGLSPLRVVKRGGSEYIVTPDGQFLKIVKGK